MEDTLAEAIRVEDEAERLVALQAIETFRALRQAVKTAPHGQGLATVEAVVRDKGFEQLCRMYQEAVTEHPEAKKRGLQFKVLLWQERFVPPGDAQASVVDGGDDAGCPALLRVPDLRADLHALRRLGGDGRDSGHGTCAADDRDGQHRLVVRQRQRQAKRPVFDEGETSASSVEPR